MRRVLALLAATGLVASLAASSVAAAPNAARPLFIGEFDLVTDDGATIAGHVSAELRLPTGSQLVPGSYSFYGVPGWGIRESHSQLGHVSFWFDPGNPGSGLGGSNVAFADGVECLYFTDPGNAFCHEFAVMFIDDLDPSLPDQVAFADTHLADGGWDFTMWFKVGKGAFVLAMPAS